MKKTILLIVLATNFIFCVYAQGTVHASYSKFGKRYLSEKITFEDYKECDITFTLKDNYITADDKARSVYKIIRKDSIENKGNRESQDYICTDEKDRDCILTIAMYTNGEKYLILYYHDWAIIYKFD
jgi:hypothetical protein